MSSQMYQCERHEFVRKLKILKEYQLPLPLPGAVKTVHEITTAKTTETVLLQRMKVPNNRKTIILLVECIMSLLMIGKEARQTAAFKLEKQKL